ncbi:MAG: hypothetical protein WA118_07660 [Carboxydocellales bacterium]
MAEKAFADQTTITNPRTPLVAELADIYRRAYYGTDISIEEYPSTLMTAIEAGTDYAVHPTIQ